MSLFGSGSGISSLARLWQIARLVRRYDLLEFAGRRPHKHTQSRGERLRLALQALGPVFIKFGQALSTRPDLLPLDVAVELAALQDRVAPFPAEQARAIIETELGASIETLFAEFDDTPLAAASVAQVHAARLKSSDTSPGAAVVVKVLRPGVEKKVDHDIALLKTLAGLVERFHPLGRRLRPKAIVAEYERVLLDELDLMREGANCSQLRRNWLDSALIYHPEIYWDYTRTRVLVMERIYGTSLRDIPRLRASGVDFRVLAERGVEIFFKQVFRDNFFHADMHPGNIFVDISEPALPSYIAVDFGIVGTLSPVDQRYLAANFVAFFNRDYRRVAELHLESGWIPPGTRVEDFESAIRTVCEPIFNKPIKDISFGAFVLRLFQIARRFNYQVQPQLVLLQKTLLTIEGLGRQLYPELDLWKTAKPIMEKWMWDRIGPAGVIKRLWHEAPTLAEMLPQIARRSIEVLTESGPAADRELAQALRDEIRIANRRSLLGIAGASCFIGAVGMYAFAVEGGWTADMGAMEVLLLAVSAGCWWRALRR